MKQLILFFLCLGFVFAQSNKPVSKESLYREIYQKQNRNYQFSSHDYFERHQERFVDEGYPIEGPEVPHLPFDPSGWISASESLPMITGIIKDDFLVNDDMSGSCSQYDPEIAMDVNGNFVAVWVDYRNGHSDIFAQRFNSQKQPLGDNFKVNDDWLLNYQWNPAIDMDGHGNFVIVWSDYRNGQGDIYGQRYRFDGQAIWQNFRITDDITDGSWQSSPDISVNVSGEFIVVWADERESYRDDIYGQRYDASGRSIGTNFKVSIDTTESGQYYPQTAMDNYGNFVVVWQDYRNEYSDIFGQLFNNNGQTKGVNFIINDDTTSYKRYPSVDMDKQGNFVVVWNDSRNSQSYYYPDLYAQRFNSFGQAIDSNFKVNNWAEKVYGYSIPDVSVSPSGNFVVAWADKREYSSKIYAQYYTSDGQPVFDNFKISDEKTWSQYEPAVALNDNDQMTVVWDDYYHNNTDIFAQSFKNLGVRNGSTFQINNDIGSAAQYEPKIAMADNGNFMIAWEDKRQGANQIYTQFYQNNGQAAGTNLRINETSYGYDPDISMNSQGEGLVVWNYYNSIYGQRFTDTGDLYFSNFEISADPNNDFYDLYPHCAIADNNNFVIVWKRKSDYPKADIYARLYNRYLQPLGEPFMVNDTSASIYYYGYQDVDVAMDAKGNFVVVWKDRRNDYYQDIYGQRFDTKGNKIGENFQISVETHGSYNLFPAIAMNDSGNFTVIWKAYYYSKSDYVYAQLFDSSGQALGHTFKVNDTEGISSAPYNLDVSMADNGNFVVSWLDRRFNLEDPYIVAQRYDSYGNPIGSNYISVDGSQWHSQTQPAVTVNNNQIVFAWQDNRRHKGWDVYAKIVDWNWEGITSLPNTDLQIPQKFVMNQNYPNPFNPTTTIKYALPKASKVKLEVFNVLGQKVATMVNARKAAGYHQVTFNGSGLPSGVYYYRLETDGRFIKIRKLVLLK